MSGGAFVSDQLAPVKRGEITVPWEGKSFQVRFLKTENNYVFGSVKDIAVPLFGDKCKRTSRIVSDYLTATKCNYGSNIKAVVSQVQLFIYVYLSDW
jgi:hypothetical protein